VLAVALEGKGFERSAGHIAAGSRKPLGDVVGDVQRNFHILSSARERRSAAAVETVNSLAFFFQVLSTSLAGQAVGIKEVDDGIWLVTFMDYDLGYIDLEEKTLQPLNNPVGPKV